MEVDLLDACAINYRSHEAPFFSAAIGSDLKPIISRYDPLTYAVVIYVSKAYTSIPIFLPGLVRLQWLSRCSGLYNESIYLEPAVLSRANTSDLVHSSISS